MHQPTVKDLLDWTSYYVTGSSLIVNLLPKDSFLDGYPRAKKAYNSAIAFLAGSALNIRKCLPGLSLHIPGLGFDKPQVSGPNPNLTINQKDAGPGPA